MVIATNKTLTATQAPKHVGEWLPFVKSVWNKIFDQLQRAYFYKHGWSYPNNPFTVVIMFKDRSNFSYKPEVHLEGKTICVTGKIKEYKGRAEMIVDKEEQVIIQ